MSKKPPRYEQYGITKIAPGKYERNGKPLSERQMRKIVGTPAKDSPGVKEYRQARYGTTEPSEIRKPTYKERLADFLKKTPGGTEEWFKSGKQPEISYEENRTATQHNRIVDKQRQDAIRAQRKVGLITESEYNSMMATERLAASYRAKVARIEDRIRTAKTLSREEYLRLRKEQQVYLNQYQKYENKLRDTGAIPDIDEFKYGWYGGEKSPGSRTRRRKAS